MKAYIFILLIPFLLCFGGKAICQVEQEEEVIITKPAEDSADINTFYDDLSKDGEWIKVDKEDIDNDENLQLSETVDIDEDVIADYIWRPRIAITFVDWNPYTYGHWEFTRFGWVWVSDYEWGWAPYHYGRWWFSGRWGWVWSPGHRWAPCWVSWCHTRHHIGWHPISPRTHWRHHKGIIITHPITPKQKSITNKWTFVKKEDFTKKVTNETAINLKNNKDLVSDARITTSGKEVYNSGPKKQDIENTTGAKITTKKVSVVNINNGTSINNNFSKSRNLNENNTKNKNKEINRSTENNNTKEKQINKNTGSKNKQENTTTSPNNRQKNNNKNTNTNRESNKNSNTKKESNKNSNTNKESNRNSNTKKESYNNSNTYKETYKAPTYNPGNSNSNTNRETHRTPTYNPGNSNRNSNSNNNNGSRPNNSPSHNSGNSNKNSSPPPKRSNS